MLEAAAGSDAGREHTSNLIRFLIGADIERASSAIRPGHVSRAKQACQCPLHHAMHMCDGMSNVLAASPLQCLSFIHICQSIISSHGDQQLFQTLSPIHSLVGLYNHIFRETIRYPTNRQMFLPGSLPKSWCV